MDKIEQLVKTIESLQASVSLLTSKVNYLTKENELIRSYLMSGGEQNAQPMPIIFESYHTTSAVEDAAKQELPPAAPEPIIPQAPPTLEVFLTQPISINLNTAYQLANAIKHDYYHTISMEYIRNDAFILLHLHNTPNAKPAQLRVTSKAGSSGFSNQLARLKTRGYIVVSGVRTYALTPKAHQIMYKCFVGS